MTDEQILAAAKQAGMTSIANPKAMNALGRSVPQRWLIAFARAVEGMALVKESARTADAERRAAHFEQRLDAANSLGNAARDELAQLTTRAEALQAECDLMEKRLIHSMNHLSENDRHAYGRHVLYIGGMGDLSDICSFIDPRLKIR